MFLFCLCFLCFGRLPSGQPKNERKTGIKLVGDSSIDFESNRIESPPAGHRPSPPFVFSQREARSINSHRGRGLCPGRERERDQNGKRHTHARMDVCVYVRTCVRLQKEREAGSSFRFDSIRFETHVPTDRFGVFLGYSLFHSVDSADGSGGVPTGVGTGGEGLGVENGFPVYCVLHRIGSHRIGSHRIGLYGLVIVSFGNGVVW